MSEVADIPGAIERVKRGSRNKDVLLICGELEKRITTKAPKNGDWPQWKDVERKKLWGKLTQAVRRARKSSDAKKIRTAERALRKVFPDAALLKGGRA